MGVTYFGAPGPNRFGLCDHNSGRLNLLRSPIHRAEREVLVQPEDVTVLNEHGDITIGHGRRAMTYMGREVQSVTYIR